MEIKKLSKNEIEKLKNQIPKRGRKPLLDEYVKDMQIGDIIEIKNLSTPSIITNTGKRLNMKFSTFHINNKYYIKRIA